MAKYNIKHQDSVKLTIRDMMNLSDMSSGGSQRCLAEILKIPSLLTRKKSGRTYLYNFPLIKEIENRPAIDVQKNSTNILKNSGVRRELIPPKKIVQKNSTKHARETSTNNARGSSTLSCREIAHKIPPKPLPKMDNEAGRTKNFLKNLQERLVFLAKEEEIGSGR